MNVRINGQPLECLPTVNEDGILVLRNGINPKLKKIAITLWTVSGSLFTKSVAAASNGSFYERMQPLYHVLQEFALGLGGLALLTGIIMLAFKKRWGKSTLKVTSFVIGGVFLIPSAMLLLAIIGIMLNDAMYEAFKGIREADEIRGVFKNE
jgi:hypothetical protein